MTSYFVFYWFICKSPRLGVVPIFIFRYSNFSGKLKLNDDPSFGLVSKLIFSFSLLIGEEDGDADDLLLSRLPAALVASSREILFQ